MLAMISLDWHESQRTSEWKKAVKSIFPGQERKLVKDTYTQFIWFVWIYAAKISANCSVLTLLEPVFQILLCAS